MAKKKLTEVKVARIEAVKMDAKVGRSTINQMNKVTSQIIDKLYALDGRVAALEARKD